MSAYRIITNGKVYEVQKIKREDILHPRDGKPDGSYVFWNTVSTYKTRRGAEKKMKEYEKEDEVVPPEQWEQLGPVELTGADKKDSWEYDVGIRDANQAREEAGVMTVKIPKGGDR